MATPIQMQRTSTQEFIDPNPPALLPAMELRLFVALSPLQFAMLTDCRPILPDPYSLRFGLRSDPLKAFERAHYFMSWSAPYAEPPPRESIKKYMLCSIVFTPQGVLTLLLANILEKGDGTDPNRAGYFRIRGPLFHELRGSDANQTLFYRSHMAEPSFATAADRAAQDPFNPFPAAENCNMAQIIFLTGMYGYVLFQASNLISDGSELLLLVPAAAPVVGSVVLPILGAVPDGMMVLFSGLGSTVMLLTLPWFLAIWAGRVSLKDGKPTYQRPAGADPTTWDKLDPPGNLSLFHTGIGYGPEIVQNAWTMLYTMLGYVIIQGSAFMVDKMPKPLDISLHKEHHMLKNEARYENTFALAGLFVCIGFFGWYLWKMWKESQGSGAVSDAIAESTIQATFQAVQAPTCGW
eukprot:symbB.v1.2.041068.t1/scaffold7798.1/size9252/1